jgi:hypothetical protein
MMSFLTYITGFFMNFELLPTDRLCKLEKGGVKLKNLLLHYAYTVQIWTLSGLK